MRKIALILLLWISANIALSYFASVTVPYLGFFPYKEILGNFHLPSFITSWANFDGVHYILIAGNGYSQYEQAYFPLYPLLLKLLAPVFSNNLFLAGWAVSLFFACLGLLFFYKYLSALRFYDKTKYWTLVFFLLFPTSFFLIAIYTEGLFFFLFASLLYFLEKRNYWLVVPLAIAAGLTRIIGVLMVMPILTDMLSMLWEQDRKWYQQKPAKVLKKILGPIALTMTPVIGLLIYCLYLRQTTGDPLFFLHAQPAFGAHRSSSLVWLPQVLYRYGRIALTANHDLRYFVSLAELFFFGSVLLILVRDIVKIGKLPLGKEYFNRLGVNLFSFATLLLPTLTGTLSSIPRYVLLCPSVFLYLSSLQYRPLKYFTLLLFMIGHVILLAMFIQGYFIS